MNGFNENVIKAIIDKKDLTLITETMKIIHPEKPNVYASKYIGEGVRVFKNGDNVHVMVPNDVTVVQEVSLAKSLATGDIFDDADDVEHTAAYIVNTKLPIRGIMNNGLRKPENLEKMVSVTIGKMNDDGDIDIDEADVENGNNIIDDLLTKDSNEYKSVKGIVDDYLGNKDHDYGYGVDFSKSISSLKDEINSIKDSDISPEDSLTDNDWDGDWSIGSNDDNVNEDFASGFSSVVEKLQNSGEVQQEGDDEESMESCCRGNGDCCTTEEDDFSDDLDTSPDGSDDHNPVLATESFALKSKEANRETKAQQEGFLLKKPKKLKPIPIREIVSYITVEITAIQDSNDMAMLSGYTCSKLELVDFYLNCIDTQDDRFIVPHTRQYLVDGQKQLNALLTKILQIKPINKTDRVWRINYPSGYQG